MKNLQSPFPGSARKCKKENQSIAGSLNKNKNKTLQKDVLSYSNLIIIWRIKLGFKFIKFQIFIKF